MCRILAIPSGVEKDEALEILLEMEGFNLDGVGSVHVEDGKFVVNKKPFSLSKLLKRGFPFLDHLPHNGWTLAHLRAASHGCNKPENTHPFVLNDRAYIHNGVWHEYLVAHMLLSEEVNFEGETDTEVAVHVYDRVGMKRFSNYVEGAGVFLSLRLDGKLEIVRTSGDLELFKRKDDSYLISSEFDKEKYKNVIDGYEGWFRFKKNGEYDSHEPKDSKDNPKLLGTKSRPFVSYLDKYMGRPFNNGVAPINPYVPESSVHKWD